MVPFLSVKGRLLMTGRGQAGRFHCFALHADGGIRAMCLHQTHGTRSFLMRGGLDCTLQCQCLAAGAGCRWRDLGYLASFITFIGATTFWVSTITGVPGVLPNKATHIAEWDILFWLPQVGIAFHALWKGPRPFTAAFIIATAHSLPTCRNAPTCMTRPSSCQCWRSATSLEPSCHFKCPGKPTTQLSQHGFQPCIALALQYVLCAGFGRMTHARAVQVLGSCCFITASILFMLEVQQSWWRIEPFNLGWHVGFWNFVGGVGFWLWCAPRLSSAS